MEKQEGTTAQTNQNIEELAGSVQGCRLARAGPSGGGPHIKTTPTPVLIFGKAVNPCALRFPDGDYIRFGSVEWPG